ncbi:MAG: septum formation inhibitor Maf [Sulfurospirillaceae bacterium]|nr:septum formation inhibitor Maf [Sulfurospirillaceae bacterium]MDD3462893.1 septum formation inhibitor Maf [Sulfurospirillaceae bacterium]
MIVLASQSSTRASILDAFGVSFIQRVCDFDEDSIKTTNASHFVYRVAQGKLQTYLQRYVLDIPVLVADTVVCADNKILRKAKDVDEAREILRKQSGNSVSILTCMIFKSVKFEMIDLSRTDYLFAPFDKNELEEYLKGDDWKGKAGACMVEGFCRKYIKETIGYESTAMGLCVEKLLPFLRP